MRRFALPANLSRRLSASLSLLLVFGGLMGGCRTVSPFAPVDLSQPGWTQQQYQVVWQAKPGDSEMVCDVISAKNSSGKSFLQVSKTPIVLATVQSESDQWWIGTGPRPRSARGTTPPDASHLWVLIATGNTNAAQLKVEVLPNQITRWSNLQTGERIEGIPLP
jgi:hypothetical protein